MPCTQMAHCSSQFGNDAFSVWSSPKNSGRLGNSLDRTKQLCRGLTLHCYSFVVHLLLVWFWQVADEKRRFLLQIPGVRRVLSIYLGLRYGHFLGSHTISIVVGAGGRPRHLYPDARPSVSRGLANNALPLPAELPDVALPLPTFVLGPPGPYTAVVSLLLLSTAACRCSSLSARSHFSSSTRITV